MPSAIFTKYLADIPLLQKHALVTLQEILAGHLVAAALGLLMAVCIVQFKTVLYTSMGT